MRFGSAQGWKSEICNYVHRVSTQAVTELFGQDFCVVVTDAGWVTAVLAAAEGQVFGVAVAFGSSRWEDVLVEVLPQEAVLGLEEVEVAVLSRSPVILRLNRLV